MRRRSSCVRVVLIAAPCLLSLWIVPAGCSFDDSGAGGPGNGDDPGAAADAGNGGIGGGSDGGGVEPDPDGGTGGGRDAATPPPDGAPPLDAGDACGGACDAPGVCEQSTGTCVFVCEGNREDDDDSRGSDLGPEGDSCSDLVICPPDIPCRVECSGEGSCDAGISCLLASSCDLRCTGRDSCSGSLDCGEGRCDVNCSGQQSCSQPVHCEDACVCDISCHPTACAQPAACPAGCQFGDDCNTLFGCNTCEP